MRNRSIILTLSIALNVLLSGWTAFWLARRGGLAYVSHSLQLALSQQVKKESRDSTFGTRLSIFNSLPHTDKDVVFLGDSITDLIEWGELFAGQPVRNRGITGDTLSAVFDRIDEVVEGKPAKIFLMCGINDIQGRVSLARTTNAFRQIVNSIRARSPDTHLFVLNVLPVNHQKYRVHILEEHPGTHMPLQAEVIRLNAAIDAICREHNGITRLTLPDLVTDSGELNGTYTYDGLHLNGAGMLALMAAVAPYAGSTNSTASTFPL